MYLVLSRKTWTSYRYYFILFFLVVLVVERKKNIEKGKATASQHHQRKAGLYKSHILCSAPRTTYILRNTLSLFHSCKFSTLFITNLFALCIASCIHVFFLLVRRYNVEDETQNRRRIPNIGWSQ